MAEAQGEFAADEVKALAPGAQVQLPVSAARDQLAELVNRAAYAGQITYLTRRGHRVAALVPVQVADRAEHEAALAAGSGSQVMVDPAPAALDVTPGPELAHDPELTAGLERAGGTSFGDTRPPV